jgi:hypothetical protein
MNPTLFAIFSFRMVRPPGRLGFVTVGYVFTVADHMDEGLKVSVTGHGKECHMNIYVR